MSTLAARRPALPPLEPADWALGVSVCIPVGPGEAAWAALLADLRPLSAAGGRVICCGIGSRPAGLPDEVEWTTAPRANRAVQLNAAARACDGDTLWFLHADSHLTAADLRAAVTRGRTLNRAVGYLRLAFAADGPPLMRLNGWAANLRSRRFGMPFGDQGLMVPRSLWQELGGFDETAPYGEGHLFAWAARRAAAPLIELPAAIVTSARKYRRRGWARTTATHLKLTARQAAPQWWAWVRGR